MDVSTQGVWRMYYVVTTNKRVFKTDVSLISPAKYTIDLLNYLGRKAPSSPFQARSLSSPSTLLGTILRLPCCHPKRL
jgi:hypothetical protein